MRFLLLLAILLSCSALADGRITQKAWVEDKEPHPLDKAYNECMWNWNGDSIGGWTRCVSDSNERWSALIQESYEKLKVHLADEPRQLELLIGAQEAWESAYALDEQFLYSIPGLDSLIGNEGWAIMESTKMKKVRDRALDLAEYASVLISSD